MMDITTLDQFKDEIYGVKGTPRRAKLLIQEVSWRGRS